MISSLLQQCLHLTEETTVQFSSQMYKGSYRLHSNDNLLKVHQCIRFALICPFSTVKSAKCNIRNY